MPYIFREESRARDLKSPSRPPRTVIRKTLIPTWLPLFQVAFATRLIPIPFRPRPAVSPARPPSRCYEDPWRSDVATRRPPFILYSPPIFSRQTLPLPPPSDSSYLLRREEGRQEGRRDSFSPIFIIRYLFIIIRRNKRRTATFLFFFFFRERARPRVCRVRMRHCETRHTRA